MRGPAARRGAARLLVAAALASRAAAADPATPTLEEVERARTFFSAGAQAYAAGRYADAVRSIEQAHQIAPRPQVTFSLAQAERKEYLATSNATYLRRAIQHYKEYLEQLPSGGRRAEAVEAKADLESRLARLDPHEAQGAQAPTVDRRRARVTIYSGTPGARVTLDGGAPEELPYFGEITPGKHTIRVFAPGYFDAEQEVSGDRPIDVPVSLSLRERPALLDVVTGTAADVYVDGRLVASTPLARSLELPAGTHLVTVTARGKKVVSQEITVDRGATFELRPKLQASAQRIVASTVLAAGAATLVAAGTFAVLAFRDESLAKKIEDERASGNISRSRLFTYNGALDRRDDFAAVALATATAGAALVIGGAAIWYFDRPGASDAPARATPPRPAPRAPDPSIEVGGGPMGGLRAWGVHLHGRF